MIGRGGFIDIGSKKNETGTVISFCNKVPHHVQGVWLKPVCGVCLISSLSRSSVCQSWPIEAWTLQDLWRSDTKTFCELTDPAQFQGFFCTYLVTCSSGTKKTNVIKKTRSSLQDEDKWMKVMHSTLSLCLEQLVHCCSIWKPILHN